MMRFNSLKVLLAILTLIGRSQSLVVPDSEPTNGQEWKDQARKSIQDLLAKKDINSKAKNAIMFLGDGMDITTITAARILKGQEKGNSGPEDSLVWDEFHNVALSKTYTTDTQVPDSAGTGTAYVGGVKTRNGVIGYDERVTKGDCASTAEEKKVESFLTVGSRQGYAVGVVTTTQITHASPAATYAHSADRGWQFKAEGDCKDIASQLVHNNHKIRLFLGGGRTDFFPSYKRDLDPSLNDKWGKRDDRRHLVEEWKTVQKGKGFNPKFVWNKEQLNQLDPSSDDSVLGLFARKHMNYDLERDKTKEPSLAEMTTFAINFLSKVESEKGFLLFVEGGRIDHGHHGNRAKLALYDTLALDSAVAAAKLLTNPLETLIVVTADHGHTISFAGYQSRTNPLFHAADKRNGNDGLPFTSLLYANGPGFRPRVYETNKKMNGTGYQQISAVATTSDTVPTKEDSDTSSSHGGADVAIYADGPFAHLFRGVMQENVIPHVIAYAACIQGFGGLDIKDLDHCK